MSEGLAPGVQIHVHAGFEYPAPWVYEGRAWNEAYFLRAFLSYNDAFDIVLWNDLARHQLAPWFEQRLPGFLERCERSRARIKHGSLWLARR